MSWKLDSSYLTWQVSYSLKNCPIVFAPSDLLDELLNKFSYPGLGSHMDFIPRDPNCCSFHTADSFLPPWYPTLKMTAPLGTKICCIYLICISIHRVIVLFFDSETLWHLVLLYLLTILNLFYLFIQVLVPAFVDN